MYRLFGPLEFVVLGCISGQPLLGLGGDPVLTVWLDKEIAHADYFLKVPLNVRTGSPPNPNSGCPEIQPNTTNSGGPNNR